MIDGGLPAAGRVDLRENGNDHGEQLSTGGAAPAPGADAGGVVLLRGRRNAAVGRAEDAWRHEDDQLAALLEHFLLLEEPPEERDVSEDRHLTHGVLIGR